MPSRIAGTLAAGLFLFSAACQNQKKPWEVESSELTQAAILHFQQGAYRMAYKLAGIALELRPDNATACLIRGQAAHEIGNEHFAQALRYLKKAKETGDPQDAALAASAARKEIQQGRLKHGEAISFFLKLRKERPNEDAYAAATHALARLYYGRIALDNQSPYLFGDWDDPKNREKVEAAIRHDRDLAIRLYREFLALRGQQAIDSWKDLSSLLIARGRKEDLDAAEECLKTYEKKMEIAKERAKLIRDPNVRRQTQQRILENLSEIVEARDIIRKLREHQKP